MSTLDKLGILKNFAWMPLVVVSLLGGCFFFEEEEEHRSYIALGFASDTTAILLSSIWKTDKGSICGPGNAGSCASGRKDLGWELKLVDVRFNKVYWSAQIKYEWSNNLMLKGQQWNDSTMFIDLAPVGYWLWTVGDKPQEITLNWNTKEELLTHFDYNWFNWKNDSILLFSNFPSSMSHLVIDTKTKTVNRLQPDGEIAWIADCRFRWRGKEAGNGCLIVDEKYGRFSLLSEGGDTLSSIIYFNMCEKIDGSYKNKSVNVDIQRYFIGINWVENWGEEKNPCYYPVVHAAFRYGENGNIAPKPSFGYGRGAFVDSLGNIVEY